MFSVFSLLGFAKPRRRILFSNGIAMLSAFAISTGAFADELVLRWVDNSANESGFRVERKTAVSDFQVIGTSPANEPSFADSAAMAGESYWYRVCAYNSFGSSAYATSSEIKLPAAPVSTPVSPPTIGVIANVSIKIDQGTGAIGFSVSDPNVSANSIVLSVSSSNPDLLPVGRINFGGLAAGRWISATPFLGQAGVAVLTIVASNGSSSSSRSFTVTVLALSAPPTPSPDSRGNSGTPPVATATLGPRFYFGQFGASVGDVFGVLVRADGSASMLGSAAWANVPFAPLPFTVSAIGDFSGTSSAWGAFAGKATELSLAATFTDRSLAINGTADVSGGAISAFAGLYSGAICPTVDGQVTALVGPSGRVLIALSLNGVVVSTLASLGLDGTLSTVLPNGSILSLGFDPGNATFGGRLASGGRALAILGNREDGLPRSSLINLSGRAFVESTAGSMIAGFSISGVGNKPLLVRAIGPTLALFGVRNALPDSRMTVWQAGSAAGSAPYAQNDDWAATAVPASSAASAAFALPAGSRDAAMVLNAAAGGYSTEISGVGGSSGTALVELYDAQSDQGQGTARLNNISLRTWVGAGERVVVAGFVIGGNSAKRLLIRAVGPELGLFGIQNALSDPQLTLFQTVNGDSIPLLSADNLDPSDAVVAEVSARLGAFPLGTVSKSAGLVVYLEPGAYTVVVAPGSASGGIGLLEVYEIP